MTDFLAIMAAPFAACLALVGIHAYLGIHVLARGVIFVDLALAQIAALGAVLAVVFDFEIGGRAAYAFSLAFTILGAAAFALTRTNDGRVPQEAFIGIVYAVASAAVILVMDRLPHGAEEIKAILVGSILWVGWGKVAITAALYSVIGVLHWLWRGRFMTISFEPYQAVTRGWNLRLWDFLFYATFGVVVTSSVQIAGVLLVFCFLIVPAVASTLIASNVRSRLVFGWAFGAAVSVAGCAISYAWDLPTGAAVVCAFGVSLAGLGLVRRVAVR